MVSRGYEAPIADRSNAGAIVFLFVRRLILERAALAMCVVAAGSSALFGLGMRSPLLASVRVLSHLAL
jgi:hypothetical protein